MQCSKESLAKFFYNVSSSSFLLFLFIYYSSVLLAKFFHFVGSYPLILRTRNEFEYSSCSEEEEDDEREEESEAEEEEEEEEDQHQHHHHHHHLVADVIDGGESLVFLPDNSFYRDQDLVQEFTESPHQDPHQHESDDDEDEDEDGSFDTARFSDLDDSEQNNHGGDSASPTIRHLHNQSDLVEPEENSDESLGDHETEENNTSEMNNTSGGESVFVFSASRLESTAKKLQVQEKDNGEEEAEIFGDSCTVGSTSKSSSEWRSSITYRDSGTEDPFSSSSRRSCPKWESYTVFQKYDEEMMFLDRVSAQKLHETESLRSIQACPRSISERIVHKFATINQKPADIRRNPYHELEATYVAQICLTWEALNWNYKNFQRKLLASRRDRSDPGCPARIAQQFQQFQVLLQRYIENEPYEQGRRPEVYARMRLLAPKLLLVPEYRDCEDDVKDEGFASRISSAAFVMIMEEGVRTFMNFLKADKERPCQVIKSFFGINRRGSVDPTLLNLIKKVNNKKKTKLKDLRRSRKCIRKKRLTVEEEVEILMSLVDLKVVSRVLRMGDISEEQMHWCEEKMSRVRVSDGKLQRDSSPLFFPAQ